MIHEDLKNKHQDLIKEAFVGLVGRVAKTIVKNPLKSFGAGMTVLDSANSMTRLHDVATGGHNIAANIGRVNM